MKTFQRYVLEADLTWTGESFERGVRVAVGADGKIEAVGNFEETVDRRLTGRALLPGFVSAHSHAFQRALRGRGERFPRGGGSFWSWREAMYGLVRAMDEETLLRCARGLYREMLSVGITSVGEFHYLHHNGTRDWAFDQVMLEGARQAGIRIVLLQAYYATGGVGAPLDASQERFDGVSPEVYWERFDALAEKLGPQQSLGCVVHSMRAAPLDELEAIHAESVRRGLPFHMHLEEQPKEIEDVKAAYGARPLALVNQRLAVDDHFVAVHATHALPADLEPYQAAGGRVCLCPLTEANLGDGIPAFEALQLDRLSLGTDSNARVDLLEEARWMEYGGRLKGGGRGVFVDADGQVARPVLNAATLGGAEALGLRAGSIEPGRHADFATIDLERDELRGFERDNLAENLLFGVGAEVVAEVCVGGVWRP